MTSDKYFIQNPDKGTGWPHWPFLPMKRPRPTGGPEGGTIIDRNPIAGKIDPEHVSLRTVYLATVWSLLHDNEAFTKAEKKVYASVDEMLADGWVID